MARTVIMVLILLTAPSACLLAAKAIGKSGTSKRRVALLMPAQEKKIFTARLDRVNPNFKKLWQKIKAPITVRLAGNDKSLSKNYALTKINGDKESYEIILQRYTLLPGGQFGYHIEMHEIAHLIDQHLLTAKDRRDLINLWRQDLLWQDCFPGPETKCVDIHEVIADQLAFWATGDKSARTSYNLPPLFTSDKPLNQLAERILRRAR